MPISRAYRLLFYLVRCSLASCSSSVNSAINTALVAVIAIRP